VACRCCRARRIRWRRHGWLRRGLLDGKV